MLSLWLSQASSSIIHSHSTCIQVPRFSFLGKKISVLEWGSKHISGVHDALPIELYIPSPWEQAGGKEGGIQVLVLGAHTSESNFLLWSAPDRCCHCGSWLDTLAIRPNSSIIHSHNIALNCMQVPRFSFLEKKTSNFRT